MPTPRCLLALPAALLLFAHAPAQQAPKKTALDAVKKDLEFLAGDECQGRGLETKGILKAGEYIADTFKAAGLKPAFKDGYFQPFEVAGPSKLGTPLSLVLKRGDTQLKTTVGEEFVVTLASGNGKVSGGVVFVGYGITSNDPKYDDYGGLDVKGKVVVAMRRLPRANDPKGPFGENHPAASLTSKIENARKHEAAGILFVSDTTLAEGGDKLMPPEQAIGGQLGGPVLHVKRGVIDTLLEDRKTTLAEIEKGIEKGMMPNSFELKGWEAATEVTVTRPKFPTRNVVGVCEGAGPLANETVVIGAHYDHLGSGEPGSFPGGAGKTHYGADDNGSGTTGLLELARRYGAAQNRQGRRIVFVAFSGEEQGLHGSKFYCDHPAFPNDTTAFMLNMDMIGRMIQMDDQKSGDEAVKKDRLVVYGTGTSTGLEKLVDDTNKRFDFKLFKIAGGSGPSDHTSFYNKKIPVLFFFTGTHKDYHRPTDTPDKINTAGLLKVVDFVQTFADHYATAAEKPDFLRTKGGEEDPTDTTPRAGGRVGVPKIKFTPGNYGEEDKGVLVDAVEDGGPAAKGGIKEGDFIIEIAGHPIKNMTAYMQAMGGVKPDTEVEMVVLRNKQPVKVKVTPIK